MIPYFYNIEKQLFSNELLNELESFVLNKDKQQDTRTKELNNGPN